MPNEKITQMLSDAPGQVSGIEDTIVQVDNEIAQYQEEQDALQEALEQIYSEVIPVLNPQCDFLYHGDGFYSGSGIGTIDSNIVNWQSFNLVSSPATGSNYYDVSVSPPEQKPYDPLLPFTPYQLITIDDTEVQDKYDEFSFIIDSIHHPMDLSGTYGTKANIAMLNGGKGTLNANKNKLLDSQTKLARFGE